MGEVQKWYTSLYFNPPRLLLQSFSLSIFPICCVSYTSENGLRISKTQNHWSGLFCIREMTISMFSSPQLSFTPFAQFWITKLPWIIFSSASILGVFHFYSFVDGVYLKYLTPVTTSKSTFETIWIPECSFTTVLNVEWLRVYFSTTLLFLKKQCQSKSIPHKKLLILEKNQLVSVTFSEGGSIICFKVQ